MFALVNDISAINMNSFGNSSIFLKDFLDTSIDVCPMAKPVSISILEIYPNNVVSVEKT